MQNLNETKNSALKLENALIRWEAIDAIKNSKKQFRKHSKKKIDRLAKQIKHFKIFIPIVIDTNNEIVAGFARFNAAKILGLKTLPVIQVSHLTPEELEAYKIAENQSVMFESDWNLPLLKLEFQNFVDTKFDLELTGFEIPKIDVMLNERNEKSDNQDEIISNELETLVTKRVKSGDIWQLGNHKLLCADSTKIESFKFLLGDEKVNMVLTDFPFNMSVKSIVGNGKIKHPEFAMASGEMSSEEFTQFLSIVMQNIQKFCLDGTIAEFFMDWRHITNILEAGKIFNKLLNICVWNKLQGGMGTLYRSQHEFIFIFKNGTNSHTNNIQLGKYGRYRTNVWDYKGVRVSNPENRDDLKYHPTVKPVKMLEDAILDVSNPNEIVLDCFAGSGSTLLACENTNRCCRAIEYEPHYSDVILYRWQLLTGKEPVFIRNVYDERKDV